MSTSLFPVAFLRPPAADYSESTPYLEESERSEGGHFAGINRSQDQHFRCSGTVRLPNPLVGLDQIRSRLAASVLTHQFPLSHFLFPSR